MLCCLRAQGGPYCGAAGSWRQPGYQHFGDRPVSATAAHPAGGGGCSGVPSRVGIAVISVFFGDLVMLRPGPAGIARCSCGQVCVGELVLTGTGGILFCIGCTGTWRAVFNCILRRRRWAKMLADSSVMHTGGWPDWVCDSPLHTNC